MIRVVGHVGGRFVADLNHAISAFVLGSVHRFVGQSEKLVARVRVLRKERDAKAGRDVADAGNVALSKRLEKTARNLSLIHISEPTRPY